MKNLRIIFMGTPEFAVATLGSLLMNGFNVVGVVTSPDKPSGRGQKISRSAVKEFAEKSYLTILQPENLRDDDFLDKLSKFNADIFIVVAFRKLPESVWKMPLIGTINLHASLLPHYRGAAPINHVLINGETTTGVTTFFIDDQIDTGNILMREELQIYPFENAGDIHNRLMTLGARLVIKTIEGIVSNSIVPMPQSQFLKPGEKPRLAPKIFPQNCIINWDMNYAAVHNLIRGLAPNPCARSFFKNDSGTFSFKIHESQSEHEEHSFTPGQIFSDGKHFIKIACRHGYLNVVSIQLEGKKRMSTIEFLRGFKIADYTVVTGQPV
jgi:methionyl-tRNA formyltransferase